MALSPQLIEILVFLGVLAGIFALIWAAQTAARKRGEAEAGLAAEKEARKAENDMAEASAHVPDPGETKDKLSKGTF